MINIGIIWGNWNTLPSVAGVTANYINVLKKMANIEFFDAKNFNNDLESLRRFVTSKDAIWCQDFTYFHVHPDAYRLCYALLELRQDTWFGPVFFEAFGHFPQLEDEFFRFSDFFRRGDIIFFSSTADLNIFRNIVHSDSWIGVLNPYCVLFSKNDDKRSVIRQKIRDELSIPIDTNIMLYVGRINIQKNIHTILLALPGIIKKIPNTVFVILGSKDNSCLPEFGATNYKYLAYLYDLIQKYQLDDHVIFVPASTDKNRVCDFYKSADVFVNLTINHNENFGFSQLEAMDNKLPIVCTDWGGLKDTVSQGEVGYKVPTYLTNWGIRVNWLDFMEKCIFLLSDPQKRETMGLRGHQIVEENYSEDIFSHRVQNIVLAAIRDFSDYSIDQHLEFDEALFNQIEEFRRYGRRYHAENYSLYRTIIGKYASHDLLDLIPDESIPFFFTDTNISLNIISTTDPIWPAREQISQQEYLILQHINNSTNIKQIKQLIKLETGLNDVSGELGYLTDFLLKMHHQGIIGFFLPV